ncbi:MAG TPA: ABC transporter permease [Candidatus Angelobacter sp.]|nr:ABC transporter permease [Candidatus Angelobacter sp.]
METLIQDIRFGLRLLRKNPGFTGVAVLTLALGIGANTVIFSVINSVLLHSLPFRDPDSLVKVSLDDPAVGLVGGACSVPEWKDLQTRPGVFEDVVLVGGGSVNLTGSKQPERLEFVNVTPNYFTMLGARPQIGRLFGPQDFALGFAEAVVISDGLWRRAFGKDPNTLGKRIRLDNDLYTIVGVLPPGFRHPGKTIASEVEVWLTSGFSADPAPPPSRKARVAYLVLARLKPGITLKKAQPKLDIMSADIRRDFASDYPARSQWSVHIIPLQESLVGKVRPILVVLMGAVILVVLIASVNIANLLLARASGRQREISMRLALGAGRIRVIRQLLTESLVLSLSAGVVGIVTAEVLLNFVIRFVPFNIPRQNEITIDWVVLGFAALISLLTGLVFGIAPAIQSTKSDLIGVLREGARGSGYSSKTHRLRGLLIVSEMAFTIVLMIGAGLLMRTFSRLLQESPGFNSTNIVVASVWLPVPNDPKLDPYKGIARQIPFDREVLRKTGSIAGIEMAGITSDLPSTSTDNNTDPNYTDVVIEDMPDSSQKLSAEAVRVSPDYFRIIQTSLVRGRFFTDDDKDGGLPVAIIDETTARQYWPNRDPVGRRIRLSQYWRVPWLTVVGIVKNFKQDGLDVNGVPHIYTSVFQDDGRTLHVVLRTSLPPSTLEEQIRGAIQSIDPGLPVYNVRSLDEVMARSLAQRRFSAQLVGAFATMALLLACIGIYGLLAYLVGQRSQEIGVRIALGAQRSNILKLILGHGALLAGVGIVIGLVMAAVTAPLISSVVYGIHVIDPIVFLAVPLILLLVSFTASYFPARRASKISPIEALREA